MSEKLHTVTITLKASTEGVVRTQTMQIAIHSAPVELELVAHVDGDKVSGVVHSSSWRSLR